jgi:hypothetical protein
MKNHLSLLRIEELLFLAFFFATLLGTFQVYEEKNQYWKIHRQIVRCPSLATFYLWIDRLCGLWGRS